MKKIFFIVLLLASMRAQAQNSEQTKVNQSLVKLFEALAALDMKTIKEFSTRDLTILESGAIWNLASATITGSTFTGNRGKPCRVSVIFGADRASSPR